MVPAFVACLDRADPRAVAVADDSERLTYAELQRQARQIGGRLATRYGTGRYLVLRAPSTARFVTTFLGIMYSGNVPVPVDPDLPPAGVDFIAGRTEAGAVLDPLETSAYADGSECDRADASLPALVLFTSGTTGKPKGVVVSPQNLQHSCEAIAEYLDYHSFRSAAVALPLHYSYALLSQVCCMLSAGGMVRLLPGLRNPLRFARAVNEESLETFCGVPSTYHALAAFDALRPLRMPGVRVVCSAGAPMDHSKYRDIKAIFPNAVVFNNYGMTEAAPRISYVRDDDPRFLEGTCGVPMKGVDIRVVDPVSWQPLPDGQRGIVAVRGANVTAGYLHEPDVTAQAFTPDGYLISGDIGFLDRGYLFICGRDDDMFNCGGEKVAPAEIEQVLNRVPGVEMAAVRGLPDPQRGMSPVAFVKLSQPVTRRDVVARLAAELPGIKIPQQYFEVSGFPMTPNGKLQRRRLSPDDNGYIIRELQ
jgi:acyl-CoA synthetase (AMP-forming)/AMP-acid ligase II